jgi:DNA-binding transcriptional regulator YhcF (GntR family)
MLLRVDPDSPRGLAEQIADQVREAIASGSLRPSEKLPPARELAAGLDVNMHTVLRAYAELRDEGLIDLRRGRGAHVVARPATSLSAQLRRQVEDLVAQAARLGVDREQLIDEIRKVTP